MGNDNCLACAIESGINDGVFSYQNSQHTCEIGTGTTSGKSASAYTFDNYQEDTGVTAIYPNSTTGQLSAVNYTILGLIGEAGEIANKWKKLYRDAQTVEEFYYDDSRRDDLISELGDVLWYASQLSTELGASLGEVAAANIRKLNDRKDRGKIGGSGDNR